MVYNPLYEILPDDLPLFLTYWKENVVMDTNSPFRITRTALFFSGGVALYCTRMFTRTSENATDRLTNTVGQLGLLFDKLGSALAAKKFEEDHAG